MLKQIIILFWHFELGNVVEGHQLLKQLQQLDSVHDVVKKLNMAKSMVTLLQDNALYNCVLQLYKKQGITLITLLDEDFPIELLQMTHPPLVIAIKGNTTLLQRKKITIITDEQISSYAIQIMEDMMTPLQQHVVLSSILSNVCAISFEIAKANCVPFMVVLASGFNYIYPLKHLFLEQYVQYNGCVISEYPLTHRFCKSELLRHREFIAALSKVIFVAECQENSYALLTAYYGIALNKDIVVPPANLYVPTSVGANMLLKEGAMMYLDKKDIEEVMGNNSQ